MLEVTTFESFENWPHILFLGSIHGDEKCGTIAIDDAIEKFQTGKWRLQKGKITFIPRANREAYDADVRQIDYNLNRIFDAEKILSTEHKVAKHLEKYLANADFVVDLHSVYSGDTPFVFLDSDDEIAKNLCKNLSLPFIMTGWNEIYADKTEKDTISFAISRGVQGVTIECGSHKNSESNEVAKKIISEVLEFFDLISEKNFQKIPQKWVKVEKIFYRGENATFQKNFKNFDTILAGETIWFSDNKAIIANEDAVMILPKNYGNVGDEWFYLGKILR